VSRRTVIALFTTVLALVAAGLAVGGALLLGDDPGASAEQHATTTVSTEAAEPEPPALELAVFDRDDPQARSLRRAEGQYERGERADALRRFERILARDPDSPEAAVGAIVAAWPDRTVTRLRGLADEHPDSAVVRLNLGLALLAEGDTEGAQAEWAEAEGREPDAPAALSAEDLLNPDSPPGRPQFFVDSYPTDVASMGIGERIATLERRAERQGSVRGWLLLGSTLEQAGHRISARVAYDRAVRIDPRSLDARVAAAVGRFDKDDPSQAFSRLGPLAEQNPDAAVVRYHLGLMLLWLPNLEEARRQLTLAQRAAPDAFYGRQAERLLTRLAAVE
jgi:tetratricopeptide (TPR) repeat protein